MVGNEMNENQLQASKSQLLNFIAQPLFKTLVFEEDLLEFDKKLIENDEFRFQIVCIL